VPFDHVTLHLVLSSEIGARPNLAAARPNSRADCADHAIARAQTTPYSRRVPSHRIARAGSVLSDLVERLPFRERLREHAVWPVWAEVVGPLLASKTEPLRIEEGKLFVRVANSAWMQELQFLKDDIRSRLNHRLGAPVVRGLYLVLGAGRPRQKKEDGLPIHPVDESAIYALVPDVRLPEIEAAIRRVARARARRLGPEAARDSG
jgi:predicted nucleic acid-binding Zn ribbon protein